MEEEEKQQLQQLQQQQQGGQELDDTNRDPPIRDDSFQYGIEIGYSTTPTTTASTTANTNQDTHWIRQGRGVFAKQAFSPGDYLCAIPFPAALVLSADEPISMTDAERGLLFLQTYYAPFQQRKSHTAASEITVNPSMSSDPMDLTSGQPWWDAYLACLPTKDGPHFDPTPDFFSDDELAMLQLPSSLLPAVQERRRNIEMMADEAGIEREILQFATWLVNSRSISLMKLVPEETTVEEEENEEDVDETNDNNNNNNHITAPATTVVTNTEMMTTMTKSSSSSSSSSLMTTRTGRIRTKSVLIPLIDMVNHSSSESPNAELQVIESNVEDESFYTLQAIRSIEPGEEITISYGPPDVSSWELFWNYGFLPQSS